jgi:hypothetical protein
MTALAFFNNLPLKLRRMKKVILLALCFISLTAWSQSNQVMKLSMSKGPTFYKSSDLPAVPQSTIATGPIEKNNRLKPWLKGGPAVKESTEPKYFGPKGKFYQNRTKRN